MRNYIRTIILTSLVSVFAFSSLYAQIDIPRPNAESGPTKVNVMVIVMNINEISASTQSMTANLLITLKWKDSRLAHP
jgi:hypothetical protein